MNLFKEIQKLKKIRNLQNTPLARLANIIRLFGGYSIQPFFIQFTLTYNCNLSCKMCLQSKMRKELTNSFEELGISELNKIIENIDDSFIIKPTFFLTGGEPLIHKKFLDFIKNLKKKNFRSSITTNGLLLNDYAKKLVKLGVEQINVSLEGSENLHDHVTKYEGSFQRALEGIELLNRFKQKYSKTKPEININCTISKYNYKYLEELANIFQNVSGISSINFLHLFFFKENIHDAKNIDVEILKREILKIKNKYSVTFVPDIRVNDITGYYRSLSYKFGNKCLIPWLCLNILPNGDVPVCSLGHNIIAGNLCEDSAKRIWNNTVFRNFRKKLENFGLPFPYCERCCFRQFYYS